MTPHARSHLPRDRAKKGAHQYCQPIPSMRYRTTTWKICRYQCVRDRSSQSYMREHPDAKSQLCFPPIGVDAPTLFVKPERLRLRSFYLCSRAHPTPAHSTFQLTDLIGCALILDRALRRLKVSLPRERPLDASGASAGDPTNRVNNQDGPAALTIQEKYERSSRHQMPR